MKKLFAGAALAAMLVPVAMAAPASATTTGTRVPVSASGVLRPQNTWGIYAQYQHLQDCKDVGSAGEFQNLWLDYFCEWGGDPYNYTWVLHVYYS